MMSKEFDSGSIGYHPAVSNPCVSHLAFADDIMIFFDGHYSSLQQISVTMERFASWSGLEMNRHKTELYIAGMNEAETT